MYFNCPELLFLFLKGMTGVLAPFSYLVCSYVYMVRSNAFGQEVAASKSAAERKVHFLSFFLRSTTNLVKLL